MLEHSAGIARRYQDIEIGIVHTIGNAITRSSKKINYKLVVVATLGTALGAAVSYPELANGAIGLDNSAKSKVVLQHKRDLTEGEINEVKKFKEATGQDLDLGLYMEDIERIVSYSSIGVEIISTAAPVPSTKVEQFERFIVDGDTMLRVVEETLPRFMFSNIKKIKHVDQEIPLPESHKSRGVKIEAAHVDRDANEVVISKGADDQQVSWVLNYLIIHESAHLNDWLANKFLNTTERLSLLSKIAARIEAADRFTSGYVEGIHDEYNKSNESCGKCYEYFADVFAAYLSDDFVKLPEADRAIIRDLIKKFDPKFDRVTALNKRKKIIADLVGIRKQEDALLGK